ncbi:unnamed protein product [Schistosoma turkestanicum]|nr:unnamed protein product [Schistosoma turkestanicum]
MFGSSNSEKPTGLFAGISNNPSVNLFQVPPVTDSNIPGSGLFGNLKATTEYRIDVKESGPSFSSAQTSGKNSDVSRKVFHPLRSGNGLDKDQNDRHTNGTSVNDSAHSSYLDFVESSNHETECLFSNNVRNDVNLYWPAVKLSRLPIGYNTKNFLLNHFQHFGRIERIICQPSMDAAYIAFDSLSSANRAKRLGRESVTLANSGLPSSVLFTMARCRRQANSGSSKLCPIKSKTINSSLSPTCTAQKKITTPQSNIKHGIDNKQFSNTSIITSDNQPFRISNNNQLSSISSQIACCTQSTLSSIPRPNVSVYNNNNNHHSLFNYKSANATTLDERLFVLQECYKRDCELRSISKSIDSTIPYTDICNNPTDEPIHHAPIKGTCEDMCPELERYSRAAHQRVSIFECLPTTINANSSAWEMDHTRAVKDYQRSSADQPVPLPRELRPTSVLHRTMAYLLASIADRPEIDTNRSLWKPWYEFMWTRTRAIRKDIRQQNLCCPIVIGIIERIARFHIFCAARLVDQSVDAFDPRINSENLTQCLQTLKEMYTDLDASSTTTTENLCPNEAEFRGYMLLMKLNDQNEINEAQRLPDRIRQSKSVRFAFATHEALITNNYIRFFRLARQATCLVACLMHRYFLQIRGQALMKLSSAFAGHPKREVQLIESKRVGIPLSVLFNGSSINPSDAIPYPVQSSFDINGKYNIDSHKTPTLIDNVHVTAATTTTTATLNYNNHIVDNNNNHHNNNNNNVRSDTLNKKQISNELLEFIYNQCIDDVLLLNYSKFIQTIHLEEMIINELMEKLIKDFIEEHLIDIFHKKLNPLRQIDKQIIENVITETFDVDLHNLAQREFILELLYNEFVNQLINEQLNKLARSCLTLCISTSLYNHTLIKCCFNRFHYLIWKRKELIQQRILLNTMPTSVIADCLPLCLMINNKQNKQNKEDEEAHLSPIDLLKHSSYSRISPELLKLDDELIWYPLKSSPIFDQYPIGLYKSILISNNNNNTKTLQHHYTNIFYWISQKLKHFPLILLNNEWSSSTSSELFNRLSGLIIIGHFHRSSITRKQLLENFNKSLIDNHRLFILAVTYSSFSNDNMACATLNTNILNDDNDDMYVLNLSNSLLTEKKFQLNPFWSIQLQHGIHWIEDCFTQILMNKCCLNYTNQYEHNTTIQKTYTLPTSSSSFEMTNLFTKLYNSIDEYIDLTVLRPLANLSESWKSCGLIDPSLKSLIDQYHSIISCLLTELIPNDKILTDLFHEILILPENILNLLCINSHDKHEHETNNFTLLSTSWNMYIENWIIVSKQLHLNATINQWILTCFDKIEKEFTLHMNKLFIPMNSSIAAAASSSSLSIEQSPSPSVYLAPNLNLFFALVRNCLNNLSNLLLNNENNTKLHNIELVQLTNMSRTITKLICQIKPDNILNQLIEHFKKLNEPCMTRTNAMNLSLNQFNKNKIETYLQSIVIKRNAFNTNCNRHEESLSMQLHTLTSKIRKLENSMNETMKETLL